MPQSLNASLHHYGQSLIKLEKGAERLEYNYRSLKQIKAAHRCAKQSFLNQEQKQAKALRETEIKRISSEIETQKQALKKLIPGILDLRDQIEQILHTENNQLPVDQQLEEIVNYDERLKQQGRLIAKTLDLEKRRSPRKFKDNWWWNLEHPRDRFDWLWKIATGIGIVLSLGFTANIAPRFWVGEPSAVGAMAVLGSTLLSLLIGKEALDPSRATQFLEHLLEKMGVPKVSRSEILGCSALLFALLTGIISFFCLDHIANYYYKQASQENWWELKATSANENHFKRALAFNPDHADANFRLGFLYELRRDLDEAKKYYKLGAQNQSIPAAFRLAVLYLRGENKDSHQLVDSAVTTLMRIKPKVNDLKDSDKYKESFYIALAWARLEQNRYSKLDKPVDSDGADHYIDKALSLHYSSQSEKNSFDIPTSVHCVKAALLMRQYNEQKQVNQSSLKKRSAKQDLEILQKDKNWQRSIYWWEKCKSCASPSDPEEDYWKTKAIIFLRDSEPTKNKDAIKQIDKEEKVNHGIDQKSKPSC
jgi:hypothetical protein